MSLGCAHCGGRSTGHVLQLLVTLRGLRNTCVVTTSEEFYFVEGVLMDMVQQFTLLK